MKKFTFIFVALIMALSSFMLVGCGKEQTKSEFTTIKLNEVTHSIFYAPLYVAINNGYFEDENIKIDLTNGGGADKSMTAILSNDADIGLMGPEAAVYVHEGKADDVPVVFGQLTKRDGSFIVSKTDIQDFTLDDLVGHEIIGGRTGGMPAMTLQYAIEQAGLEIGKGAGEVDLNTNVDFNLTASVFESTDAQFCTLFQPTASDFAKAKGYYVVESVGMLAGEVPYTAFMAKDSWLQDNQEVAYNFLKAVYRGYRYLQTASLTDITKSLKPSFAGFGDESIVASIESYIESDAWNSSFEMTETVFNTLQDVMTNAGELDNKVAFKDVVDNSIAKKVANYFA